jgi:hypothetical protein
LSYSNTEARPKLLKTLQCAYPKIQSPSRIRELREKWSRNNQGYFAGRSVFMRLGLALFLHK